MSLNVAIIQINDNSNVTVIQITFKIAKIDFCLNIQNNSLKFTVKL